MAGISGNNTQKNRVQVSHTGSKYYADLAKETYEKTKLNMETVVQAKEILEQQIIQLNTLNEELTLKLEVLNTRIENDEISNYGKIITCKTTQHIDDSNAMSIRAYQGANSLKKIYITSDCLEIGNSEYTVTLHGYDMYDNPSGEPYTKTFPVSDVTQAPFYGLSSGLIIYVQFNEDEIPDGWMPYWNYRTKTEPHTTVYGATLEQYKNDEMSCPELPEIDRTDKDLDDYINDFENNVNDETGEFE